MTDNAADSTITAPEATDSSPSEQVDTAPDNKCSERLESILSIKVPIIVKITQKKLCMIDILKFNLGNVIHFDQDAYQHVELMVNNTVIGLGQPVKIGENFGLKIVQIGDINDTIKALKSEN
ncbi:MAG: FliM/FliN family flagellar motor switch protein [Planctomycetes bacterium]|nr:FliM/FliN family flagellar motor switch protein [Planctomycetota bacterium]